MAKTIAPPPAEETKPVETAAAPIETPQETAPQTAVQETVQAPSEPSFLDVLKEKGFTDVADEKSAQQRLLEAWETERKQIETLTQRFQQLEPLAEAGQRYLLQQAAPEPEQKPAQESSWWTPPKVDLSLVRRFQETKFNPETQQTVTDWKPGTPAELRSSYEAYQAHQEQWAQKLVENPAEALQPFKESLKAEIRAEFEELYGAKVGAQTEQQFYQKIDEENKDWLYEHDPVTRQPLVDRMTGDLVLSKQGQEVVQHWRTLSGVEDLNARWMYATAMLQRDKAVAQSQVAETRVQAASVAEQKRSDLIKRNTSGAANRNGSQPAAEVIGSQNKNLTPGQKFQQNLRRDGVSLPS